MVISRTEEGDTNFSQGVLRFLLCTDVEQKLLKPNSMCRLLTFSWDLQTFAQIRKLAVLDLSLFKSSAAHNCFYAFFNVFHCIL